MTQELKYPPLPKAVREVITLHQPADYTEAVVTGAHYTADQMRAYADAAIARDRQMWYDPTGASNYGEILTLLGMEEEGDPVADVKRLLLTHEAHSRCTKVKMETAQSDAALAQQAARHSEELDAYALTVSNRDAEIEARLKDAVAREMEIERLRAQRVPDTRSALEAIIDIWDDGKNPEPYRTYVGDAFESALEDARATLSAAPAPEPEHKPAHTEAEVQELLMWIGFYTDDDVAAIRRILNVPAPEDKP